MAAIPTPAKCTSFDCYKYPEDTPLQLAQLTMDVLHAMSLDNDFKLPVIHNRDDCSRWLKMIESVQLYGWVELRGFWTYMEVKVPLVKHTIAAYAVPYRDFPLEQYDPTPPETESSSIYIRRRRQRAGKCRDVHYAPCASVVNILIYIRPVLPLIVVTRFFAFSGYVDRPFVGSFANVFPGERGANDALRSQITHTDAGLDDHITCVMLHGLPCLHRDTQDLPFPVHAVVDIWFEHYDANDDNGVITFAACHDMRESDVPTTVPGRGRSVNRLSIQENRLVAATGMSTVVKFHAVAGMPEMITFPSNSTIHVKKP